MQQVITPGPAAVRRAAKSRLKLGGYIIYIGQYQGQEVYTCKFDEEVTIGPPEVYLWDGHKVTTITGENALDYLNPYNL
ncbi:MAG: hypothetical protein II524_01860 [Bacteroidales bacterium]|nr:hypothetical protein [Bacteroidales bacterium]